MKLRIKGDTVRLRLTRGEVTSLDRERCCESRVHFGPGSELVYRIRADAAAPDLVASFDGRVIEVRVPAARLDQWCRSDEVTLSAVQRHAGAEVGVVVEKDFACLEPRAGEDESDQFPHPRGRLARRDPHGT